MKNDKLFKISFGISNPNENVIYIIVNDEIDAWEHIRGRYKNTPYETFTIKEIEFTDLRNIPSKQTLSSSDLTQER